MCSAPRAIVQLQCFNVQWQPWSHILYNLHSLMCLLTVMSLWPVATRSIWLTVQVIGPFIPLMCIDSVLTQLQPLVLEPYLGHIHLIVLSHVTFVNGWDP